MSFFLYLIVILISVFIFGMTFLWVKEFLIRRERSEDKKEDFVNYFVSQGISEVLTLSVYNYLENWMNFKDFPVRPQDNIADIYGIVDEDLDDLIIETAQANSLEIPQSTEYWDKPIITVEDLIRFIASFTRKSIYE